MTAAFIAVTKATHSSALGKNIALNLQEGVLNDVAGKPANPAFCFDTSVATLNSAPPMATHFPELAWPRNRTELSKAHSALETVGYSEFWASHVFKSCRHGAAWRGADTAGRVGHNVDACKHHATARRGTAVPASGALATPRGK